MLSLPQSTAFCSSFTPYALGRPISFLTSSHRSARPTWTCSSSSPTPSSPSPARTSRRALLHALAAASVLPAVISVSPPPAAALTKKRIMAKAGPLVELSDGVSYRDISGGKESGFSPSPGDTVAIHYSLFYDGLEIESSRESQGLAAQPLGFTFGAESGPGSVMKGINVGIDGMKVGGMRLVTIPGDLAYGAKGKMPLIPPDATVEFVISLLSVKRPGKNVNASLDGRSQVY
jgi:FKBP-type peptidyl-prolyl cis-trans isomerase